MSETLKKELQAATEKTKSVSLPKSKLQSFNESLHVEPFDEEMFEASRMRKFAQDQINESLSFDRLRVAKQQLGGGAGLNQTIFESMTRARLKRLIKKEVNHFIRPVVSKQQRKEILNYLVTKIKKQRSRVSKRPEEVVMPSSSRYSFRVFRWRKVIMRLCRKFTQLIILVLALLGMVYIMENF